MNTLARSLLFSTVFISSFFNDANDALAARLIINGSDQASCPVGNCGANGTGGVDFQTDNKLVVQNGQNVGQTGGVSVIASGGNNIGDIFFQGTSTILGSVTPTGNILRLIELDPALGAVTANSDVRVSTLYLPGTSTFSMVNGSNLTANVKSNNGLAPNSTLSLLGSHTVTGDIGTSTDWMTVLLSGGPNSIVQANGNIFGNISFLGDANEELRIAPNKNITGRVFGTGIAHGIVTFEGNSQSGSLSNDWIGNPIDGAEINQVNINAGTLTLNHNIYATNTIVNTCAKLLVSNDVIVRTNLVNNGRVQIGTLTGPTTNTLTVGTYTGNSGSSLDLIVTNAGLSYSTLNADTQVTIPTDGLNLFITGNTIPNGRVLANIITTPALTLAPNTPANTATYRFTPTYVAPNLSISVQTIPMSHIVPVHSGIFSIAQFFDTIGPTIETTAPALVPLYDALNAQPNELALDTALASLTLPVNGNLLGIAREGANRGFSVISERMDNNRAEFARGETRYKCAQFYPYCCQEPPTYSMKSGQWLEFYYSAFDQAGEDFITGTGYTALQWGLIGGYDKAFYPSLNAGVAFAYSHADTTSAGMMNNTLAADTYQGFLYASHELCNGLYWDGIVSLAYNNYDQQRIVDLASNINATNGCPTPVIPFGLAENAKAMFGGWQFNSYLEGGYQYRACKLVIVPHVIFKTTYLRTNEFSETGAPLTGFKNVQYDDGQEVDFGLGIKIAKNYFCCKKYKLTPYIKLAAYHDMVKYVPESTSEFIGGGPDLIFAGTEVGRDSLVTSLGLTLNRKDNSYLTFEYDFEKRSDFTLYSAFLKYRVEWC